MAQSPPIISHHRESPSATRGGGVANDQMIHGLDCGHGGFERVLVVIKLWYKGLIQDRLQS